MKSINIQTRQRLIALVGLLAEEVKSNPNAWENKSLGDYLDAMASWLEDMDGYYSNTRKLSEEEVSSVNWRVFADALMAARMYE